MILPPYEYQDQRYQVKGTENVNNDIPSFSSHSFAELLCQSDWNPAQRIEYEYSKDIEDQVA
jgi:hypothetical protein